MFPIQLRRLVYAQVNKDLSFDNLMVQDEGIDTERESSESNCDSPLSQSAAVSPKQGSENSKSLKSVESGDLLRPRSAQSSRSEWSNTSNHSRSGKGNHSSGGRSSHSSSGRGSHSSINHSNSGNSSSGNSSHGSSRKSNHISYGSSISSSGSSSSRRSKSGRSKSGRSGSNGFSAVKGNRSCIHDSRTTPVDESIPSDRKEALEGGLHVDLHADLHVDEVSPDVLICGRCRTSFAAVGELQKHRAEYPDRSCGTATCCSKCTCEYEQQLKCIFCDVIKDSAWRLLLHIQLAHRYKLCEQIEERRSNILAAKIAKRLSSQSAVSSTEGQVCKSEATECSRRLPLLPTPPLPNLNKWTCIKEFSNDVLEGSSMLQLVPQMPYRNMLIQSTSSIRESGEATFPNPASPHSMVHSSLTANSMH